MEPEPKEETTPDVVPNVWNWICPKRSGSATLVYEAAVIITDHNKA
jgi:hypothetical protein